MKNINIDNIEIMSIQVEEQRSARFSSILHSLTRVFMFSTLRPRELPQSVRH